MVPSQGHSIDINATNDLCRVHIEVSAFIWGNFKCTTVSLHCCWQPSLTRHYLEQVEKKCAKVSAFSLWQAQAVLPLENPPECGHVELDSTLCHLVSFNHGDSQEGKRVRFQGLL